MNNTKCSTTCTAESLNPSQYVAEKILTQSPPLSPSLGTPSIPPFTATGSIPLTLEDRLRKFEQTGSTDYSKSFGSTDKLPCLRAGASRSPETYEEFTVLSAGSPPPRVQPKLPFTYMPITIRVPTSRKPTQTPKRRSTAGDTSYAISDTSDLRRSVK